MDSLNTRFNSINQHIDSVIEFLNSEQHKIKMEWLEIIRDYEK
jgi:hypothetical protein